MSEIVEKPVQFVPRSQQASEELIKAFKDEGLVPADQPEKQVEGAETPAKAEEPKKALSEDMPALLRIAAEKAKKRQEAEALKPRVEFEGAFSPQEMQRLAAARKLNDPQAALAALGFTHTQYTQSLLKDGRPAEIAQEKPADEVSVLRQEIENLKSQRAAEESARLRSQGMEQIRGALKDDPKFKHVTTLEDYEGVEAVLTAYWAENKELPVPGNFAESVKLAAEVREAQLKKEAQRWQKLSGGLTVPASSASVAESRASEQSHATGTVETRTLTNGNTTAPAAARPARKSREDRLAAFLEGREAELD